MSWQPDDRPAPYWKDEEDWYEFFHFACPSCKCDYVIDQGSDYEPGCNPRPVVIQVNWDVRTAKIAITGSVICTCLAKFEVNGTN